MVALNPLPRREAEMTSQPDRTQISMPNYVDWPNQQWAFTHMRELIASAQVEASSDTAPLVRRYRDLGHIEIDFAGRRYSISDFQEAAHVDGQMIVHQGEVVHEFYAEHMAASSRHMAMSVTKSFIGTLAGILIDRGLLTLEGLVTDYLPYLAGSSWDGCTITNLLDMTAGTFFDETDYENVDSPSGVGFRILGWPPVRPDDPLPRDYIRDLPNTSAHNERFEYRSILTIVLPGGDKIGFWEPIALIVMRVLDGIGAAMLWPAAFAEMGAVVEDRYRQQAMSLLNMCYLLGIALAMLFTSSGICPHNL